MKNNWENYVVNIGNVKQRTTHLVKFKSLHHLDIDRITLGCMECTKLVDYKNNELIFQYKVEEFPKHLMHIEETIPLEKWITVYYTNGLKDDLRFIGTMRK